MPWQSTVSSVPTQVSISTFVNAYKVEKGKRRDKKGVIIDEYLAQDRVVFASVRLVALSTMGVPAMLDTSTRWKASHNSNLPLASKGNRRRCSVFAISRLGICLGLARRVLDGSSSRVGVQYTSLYSFEAPDG
jgi:hypothetical protein